MIASWIRPVEQIVSVLTTSGARIVGLLGVSDGVGVSTLAGMICDVMVSAGTPTLLLDLAEPVKASTTIPKTEDGAMWQRSTTSVPSTRMVLTARITEQTRFQFDNLSLLRQTWKNELASYSRLLIDMPPIRTRRTDRVNPLAIAASCDTIFLICRKNRTTRSELIETVDLLRNANIGLTGLILNVKAGT